MRPKRIRSGGVTTLCLILTLASPHALSVNFNDYTQSVNAVLKNPNTKNQLLRAVSLCGEPANMDENCVTSGLQNAARQGNTTANAILTEYQNALQLGYDKGAECQSPQNQQINQLIARCVLRLNYAAIQTNSKQEAISEYETCLQATMLGMAYEGNLAAQYMLSNVLLGQNVEGAGSMWAQALEKRKGTPEYEWVTKCY